jgi:hypothetical protein
MSQKRTADQPCLSHDTAVASDLSPLQREKAAEIAEEKEESGAETVV